jgi:hypothetical protein
MAYIHFIRQKELNGLMLFIMPVSIAATNLAALLGDTIIDSASATVQ